MKTHLAKCHRLAVLGMGPFYSSPLTRWGPLIIIPWFIDGGAEAWRSPHCWQWRAETQTQTRLWTSVLTIAASQDAKSTTVPCVPPTPSSTQGQMCYFWSPCFFLICWRPLAGFTPSLHLAPAFHSRSSTLSCASDLFIQSKLWSPRSSSSSPFLQSLLLSDCLPSSVSTICDHRDGKRWL